MKTWLWVWRQPARVLRKPLFQTMCRSSPRHPPLLRERRKAARPPWLARPSAPRPPLPPPPPSPPSPPLRLPPLQPMSVPSQPSLRQMPRPQLCPKPPLSKSRPRPARAGASRRSSGQRVPCLHLRSKAAARRAPSQWQKRTSLLPRSLLPRRASTSLAVEWAREAARRSRLSPRRRATPVRPARRTQTRWMSRASPLSPRPMSQSLPKRTAGPTTARRGTTARRRAHLPSRILTCSCLKCSHALTPSIPLRAG